MNFHLLSFMGVAEPRAGLLVENSVYDVSAILGDDRYTSVLGILEDWGSAYLRLESAAKALSTGEVRGKESLPLSEIRLLAPILYPGDIYCAGANYVDHIEEMNRKLKGPPTPTMKEIGEKPWHFIKAGRSTVADPDSAVPLPPYSQRIDWELELAVVIGKTARQVPAQRALECVAGYTIGNDLSARDAVTRSKLPPGSPFFFDFLSQKSFDGSCPLGPWLTPAAQLPHPGNLGMKLWVNDELMQDSNTNQMIFDTAEQIEMLSSRVTLHPGDVILTGTPAGVGMGRGMFLRSGDRLRMWIEGIGEMCHSVI
jgi:2-keto-4-pentenoate hydratase/2-oxohepta-3-ene-1,7-dioic acid hydratase in catechol pathway